MTQRLTRKDAEACFGRLCKILGKRQATAWNDVGGWELDYAPVYGGYTVAEIVNEGGGQSRPLGDGRVGARQFCEQVWFVEKALAAAVPPVQYQSLSE